MPSDKKQLFDAASVEQSYEVRLNSESYDWVESSGVYEVGEYAADGHRFVDSSFSTKKMLGFFALVVLLFGALLSRVFYLQIIHGTEYRNRAQSNSERILPIEADRGIIYDRNGIALTKNVPRFSLALVPQDLPRDEEEYTSIVNALAEITEQEAEDIRILIDKYGSYSYESIVIQEDLDYETALNIHIAAAGLPGIHIQRGSKRLYVQQLEDDPDSSLRTMSHILGYEGKLSPEELDDLYKEGYLPSDDIGKTGVEKTYETLLRGKYGNKRIEVNALGREQAALAEYAPSPGHHVRLSIDAHMQSALETIVAESLRLRRAQNVSIATKASAIVMNPNSGQILAMVSYPAFDNNDFAGGITQRRYNGYLEDEDRPLFHRTIGGTYPSGSTIKPVISAAALQEGIIEPTTSFLSSGGIQIGPWFFPDWKAGGHGSTNVRKAIAESVNTFYYLIGGGKDEFVGLGVDRIASYIERFGFAQRLGIDLPGEAAGFIPSKAWKLDVKGEGWYVGDTYNLSIGQGDLLVTPLQVASMTASIANRGTLYKPHVVAATIDPITEEERNVSPEIIRRDVVATRHIDTVRLGMRDCVLYGSCRRLGSLPFAAAGKTGTAQWNNTKENHAWFTSFAPYDNPELVVTVLVEEGGEGSGSAAPIADKFYRWWWNYTQS